MIIAIDGPAGSGKSTISKKVARRLSCFYLDTGAMYRALTYGAMHKNADLSNEEELLRIARSCSIEMSGEHIDRQKVILDGVDITDEIRLPRVTNNVKHIAKIAGVRELMVSMQRTIGGGRDLVVEGRDTTTVVFPKAEVKIYLDAKQEERARRRFKELQEKGVSVSFEEILTDQKKRDESDFNRSVGPLKIADDAVVVDTSGLSIDEVVRTILAVVAKKKPKSNWWYRFARQWICWTFWLLFRVRVKGQEYIPKRGGFIVASNHASYLDPLVVGKSCHRELNYLARNTLFSSNSFFGRLLISVNARPIKRGEADRGALNTSLNILNEGKGLLLFPEGTRTRDGKIGKAKDGLGFIACNTSLPVIPAYVHGSYEAWSRHSKRVRFSRITVRFGAPLVFYPNAESKELKRAEYKEATERVMNAIKQLEQQPV